MRTSHFSANLLGKMAVVLGALFISVVPAYAASLQDAYYKGGGVANDTNVNYDFYFSTSGTNGVPDFGYIALVYPAGYDASSVTYSLIAPGVTGYTIDSQDASSVVIQINGSIATETEIQLVAAGMDIGASPSLDPIQLFTFDPGLTGLDTGTMNFKTGVSTTLSDNAVDATSEYRIRITNGSIGENQSVRIHFPDGSVDPNINFDLSNVLPGDIVMYNPGGLGGLTSPAYVGGSVVTAGTDNYVQLGIPSDTFIVPITDYVIGISNVVNPSAEGMHYIQVEDYDGNTFFPSVEHYRLAEFFISPLETVDVTAIVSEALIMSITNTVINLIVDPAVNGGQDASEYTELTVSSNAPGGYIIQGRLDDGAGNNQLISNNGDVIASGTGENNLGFEALNAAYNAGEVVDADASFANANTVLNSNAANLGLTETTDDQRHTIYYDLNVNFLTPAGIYTGTVYYTVLAAF